ncbi:related to effector family protein Eff1 [Sporisorium reilianum f. sp. reilianum]|uniref:Related to effector family protein Eff1 n=1 Tax=Sporisorium reilianum f. sp. reilianum TaxID=72559 RepID=A0A2N8UCR0_9BASI|nr:related to effector family protein Eff1 [Sporisorium reilianum f. sp. reilianum]
MLLSTIVLRCFSSLWTFSLVSAAPMWNNGGSNWYWNPQQAGSSQPPNVVQPGQAGSSQVPANQYWDGHAWQPVVAPYDPAYPSIHDFPDSPEPNLDVYDDEFWKQLEEIPTPAQPSAHNQHLLNHADGVLPQSSQATALGANDHALQGSSGEPLQSASRLSSAKKTTGKKRSPSFRDKLVEGHSTSKGWSAPASLKSLPLKEPMNSIHITSKVVHADMPEVQQLINTELFDEKVHFLERSKIMLVKSSDWRTRSPLYHHSYLLPAIFPTGRNDNRMYVYMTKHGHARQSPHFKGLVQPYYMFWKFSNPTGIADLENNIEFLGAGYIDTKDNEAVDEAIYKALARVKQASREHV